MVNIVAALLGLDDQKAPAKKAKKPKKASAKKAPKKMSAKKAKKGKNKVFQIQKTLISEDEEE